MSNVSILNSIPSSSPHHHFSLIRGCFFCTRKRGDGRKKKPFALGQLNPCLFVKYNNVFIYWINVIAHKWWFRSRIDTLSCYIQALLLLFRVLCNSKDGNGCIGGERERGWKERRRKEEEGEKEEVEGKRRAKRERRKHAPCFPWWESVNFSLFLTISPVPVIINPSFSAIFYTKKNTPKSWSSSYQPEVQVNHSNGKLMPCSDHKDYHQQIVSILDDQDAAGKMRIQLSTSFPRLF